MDTDTDTDITNCNTNTKACTNGNFPKYTKNFGINERLKKCGEEGEEYAKKEK